MFFKNNQDLWIVETENSTILQQAWSNGRLSVQCYLYGSKQSSQFCQQLQLKPLRTDTMQSAVIMKIYSLQSSFTVSENDIAQFVTKDPEYVITSTITALAKKINTSEASINRFCKKIGYKGFNNFKVALAQSNFQREQADEMLVRDNNVIEATSSNYRSMILNASAMLGMDDIENAVSMIKSASVIHIIALYTTSFIAHEFSFKLRQLGLNVRVHTEMLDIQLGMQNVNSDSLVFLIVPSVASRDVISFITMAKDHDANVIL